MPTLSRLFSLIRPAPLRRLPFWAQAFAVCALFAIAGVALVDDYGIHDDSNHHRQTAAATADYALGVSEDPPDMDRTDRYYGMAFLIPLMLAERALGLQDTRDIFLMRHMVMHLFFIAGGFACGMLAYRMMGSRWVALFAMLMFLFHPRLYAHSFFNSLDIPFAAMLLITLYLTHRAFRKDTLGAFLLCGIGVGLTINLRVFGLMLLPFILAMRAPCMWQASDWADRKRILITGGIFAAAALATLYISHPYYWENPLRFIEGLRVLSQHPSIVKNLFMGEIYKSDAAPWNYIPVWFGITAPPVTLALGAIGCAAACWRATARPLAALRDRETRFRILTLGCFALPVMVVIALQSNIYHGLRHMHFLWAPFCLLAAVGLQHITNISMGGGIWKVGSRLPRRVRGGGMQQALAYSAVGAGLLTTLTAMAALHPYEHVYFNALVDTKTPGALANRYDMDYGFLAERQSLEYLLARYPDDTLRVWPGRNPHLLALPQEDRDRLITLENPHAADFYLLTDRRGGDLRRINHWRVAGYYLHPRIALADIPDQPPLHSIRAYGSVIMYIVAKDAPAYRAAYADVVANGDMLARADFSIYAYDGALYYLGADCPPPAPSSADLRIFLHLFPVDPADLSAASRERGFENRDFRFNDRAAFFDGKCIHRQPLPDYPIERIRTGQFVSGEGELWRADINIAARATAQAARDGIAAGDYGAPVAQSDFDVYIRDGVLAYLKEHCAAGDTDARFFLHITPVDPADLPVDMREHGFENRDFGFVERGARIGDKCVVERELPDYAIDRIRTGQFVSGEGQLWSAEFSVLP